MRRTFLAVVAGSVPATAGCTGGLSDGSSPDESAGSGSPDANETGDDAAEADERSSSSPGSQARQDADESTPPESCGDRGTSRVAAEPVELAADDRDRYEPIRVDELPDGEREILRAAIANGEYYECATGSDAFGSLVDRSYEQYERNHREHGEEIALAVDGDDWYELSLRQQDESVP